MVRFTEVDFPRGKPAVSSSSSFTTPQYPVHKKGKKRDAVEKEALAALLPPNDNDDLFKVYKPKLKVKKKKSKSLTSEETDILAEEGRKGKEIKAPIDILSYDTICEGMLSLGRIQQIKDHEIMISLPGRTMGSVPVTSISRPYTKALEKLASSGSLEDPVYGVSDMFEVGQVVSVGVIGVDKTGHATRVTLSLDPSNLHGNYTADVIIPDMVLTGAIESIEDHGYVIDLGVAGANTFLPKEAARNFIKNVNNNKPLGLGQLVKCKVTKARSGTKGVEMQTSYLTVTINPKDVNFKTTLDTISSYNLLLPGMESEGTVMETHKTGMKVDFLDTVGHIHLDHMSEPWTLPGTIEIAATVYPKVLYLLPNVNTPYLSLQTKLISQGSKKFPPLTVPLGEKATVKVQRIEKRGIIVKFDSGDRGIVTMTRCSDDATFKAEDIDKKFPIGSKHECRVLEYSSVDNMYIASFQESVLKQNVVRIDQLVLGQVFRGTVMSWNSGGAVVSIGRVKGFVPKIHFGDGMVHNAPSKYPVGTKVTVKVFRIDLEKNQAIFTAKRRLVKSDGAVLSSLENCPVATVSDGLIFKVSQLGIHVFTIGGLTGFIPASKATKETRFRLEQLFFVGQVVKFKVLNANPLKKRLILSLFWDEPAPERKEKPAGSYVKKPEVVVEEVTEALDNADSSSQAKPEKKKKKAQSENGLATTKNSKHEDKIAAEEQTPVKKKKKKAAKAEVVQEEIIEIDLEKPKKQKKKRKLSEQEINGNGVTIEPSSAKDIKKRTKKDSESSDGGQVNGKTKKGKDQKSKLKRNSESAEEEEEPKQKKKRSDSASKETPFLEFPGSSFYDFSYLEVKRESDSDVSSDEEADAESEPKPKAKKLSKLAREKAHEEEIRKAEAELVDPNHVPKTVDDFERLILASPNSSMIWIAYMSFVLQGADIDRARAVGQRALKTILFREESERENIWKALLNTEAMFGTEDSTKDLFKESLKANDELTMYKAMCSIYEACENIDEGEKLCKTMVKKFSINKDIWLYALNFYYKNGKLDQGRELFKESIRKLNKTDHIQMISAMAVNEFKYGELERARTVLDATLLTYPKRLDLWILYARQLIKKKEYDMARTVLSNAALVKFVPKRMLVIFKLFLEFETEHGTEETLAKVKELALQYATQVSQAPTAFAL